jgi:hypothetical protein
MRFTELRQDINNCLKEEKLLNDFISDYFSNSTQDKIKQLSNKFVEHLFSDITETPSVQSFDKYLGQSYVNANEYAKTCILTSYKCRSVYGYKLNGWTDSALKCFDNFLLVLIQDKLNETILRRRDVGTERQKYWHLIDKGCEYYDIGMGLDVVYQSRNVFTHVELVNDKTGKRHQKKLSQRDLKELAVLIFENFKKALLQLEKQMK